MLFHHKDFIGTESQMETIFTYFSDCDEVRAKEHTFYSFDFKQVPEINMLSCYCSTKGEKHEICVLVSSFIDNSIHFVLAFIKSVTDDCTAF